MLSFMETVSRGDTTMGPSESLAVISGMTGPTNQPAGISRVGLEMSAPHALPAKVATNTITIAVRKLFILSSFKIFVSATIYYTPPKAKRPSFIFHSHLGQNQAALILNPPKQRKETSMSSKIDAGRSSPTS
jgi:hypothetical protein